MRGIWRRWRSANPPPPCAPSGSEGNEYLQEAAPWSTIKEDPEQAAMQIRLGLNLIRLYAVLSQPFIPMRVRRCWMR